MIQKIPLFILLGIILAGIFFRIYGISTNHSFWSDEAYMASSARDILTGKRGILESMSIRDYQPLTLAITTGSMGLFGLSELGARLFSVIAGTTGILFAYLLAKRISTKAGGLLAAFIYAFSQLNLANSTQAKQYAALQTITLIIFYLFHELIEAKKRNVKLILLIHTVIIALCTISTLLHFIGVISWISYFIFILFEYRETLVKHATLKNIILAFAAAIALSILFKVPLMVKIFVGSGIKETFFTYNHITYFRELFWRNYGFITMPAIFGFLSVSGKYKNATLAIIAYSIVLSYLWIFKHYTHNIRYVVPLFGIIFVYFAVFWSRVGQEFFKGKVWITCLLIALLLFVGGYKITRKPSVYYSPNADFAADVQNANYKAAYQFIKDSFPQTSNYVIYNDTIDSHLFYLEGRAPDALFRKPHTVGLQYGEKAILPVTNTPIYTTLGQFKELHNQHPKGILIVEDWESLLPEEIKQYAKKNMKLEYRVESLEVSPTDKWPIEIYSWGMEE